MRKLMVSLVVGLLMVPAVIEAAQTAQARIYCLSVNLSQGSGPFGLYSLNLTTSETGLNGELAPSFGGVYTHWSGLALRDETLFQTYPGQLVLDLPWADEDGNGYNDFFEVRLGGSVSTGGEFNLGGLLGTVEATWSRPAGSRFGQCLLRFYSTSSQPDFEFTHGFEVLEYMGPLTYTPGETNVTGSVELVQSDNEFATLTGPVEFLKSSTNRFNQLEVQSGALTNEYDYLLPFTEGPVRRDERWPTNYFGFLTFEDGAPFTSDADYRFWDISIDDTNDSDEDGIPDFSDDPASAVPTAPILSLTQTATNLLLEISGDVGRVHEIVAAGSLTDSPWRKVSSIVLTNNPQTLSLPLPEQTTFWKVSVP